MNPPKKVKVGYRTYLIKPADLGGDRYGQCDNVKAVIRYDPEMHSGDLEVLNTVVHELLHSCWSVGALEDTDPEEKTVTVLANQLSGLLRDNPALLEWIVSVSDPR
jgi:hypothetical protein